VLLARNTRENIEMTRSAFANLLEALQLGAYPKTDFRLEKSGLFPAPQEFMDMLLLAPQLLKA
jgi:hypothetical protein